MDAPVTILMLAYNSAPFLKEAIASVRAQSYTLWQLVIIDDASTDTTQDIAASFLGDSRISYMRNETNLGLGGNRAASLRYATGNYIAILDSDDIWIDPEKLEKQVAYLDTHPDCGVIGTFGNGMVFETTDENIRRNILLRQQFLHSSVVYRKEAIYQTGGFDRSLAPAEDYDLILHIGNKWKFANLPLIATYYRTHEGNTSSNEKAKKIRHAKLHLQVIKRYKRNYPNYFSALLKAYVRIAWQYLK